MPAPAGVAKLSIAALKRTISRAGLSTDGLIERRELEEAATRALQILEERWRESSDDEESPPQSKPKSKISTKTKSQKPRGYTFAADYSLGPGEALLLSFDPSNWEAPFAVPEE